MNSIMCSSKPSLDHFGTTKLSIVARDCWAHLHRQLKQSMGIGRLVKDGHEWHLRDYLRSLAGELVEGYCVVYSYGAFP